VGWSTLRLAERYPDHFVSGSISRVTGSAAASRCPAGQRSFLRADLVDFCVCSTSRHSPGPPLRALSQSLAEDRPPRPALAWHAVFPVWLACGVFECRSNWRIYIEEMAIAIGLATGKTASCQPWLPRASR
jgi:tRNA (guanine-N7-)-methyltransferase